MGLFNKKKPAANETMPSQMETLPAASENGAVTLEDLLLPAPEIDLSKDTAFSFPISELATIGPAAASLIPALRTVTETVSVETTGLFKLANASVGDTLKKAKDGNFWGALKKADGKSKMSKLTQAGPLEATSTTVMPVDPATLMIAAALYTIEQKLDSIAETQKKILSFLENEKEAQIEADIKILGDTIKEFKYYMDDEVYITGHYIQSLDIKKTAEKNLQAYQKELLDIKVKAPVVVNANIAPVVNSLRKKFKYYQMSLYLYAMSSFVEVMLRGDFREEHLKKIRDDIEERSMRYREIYAACSAYIENVAGKAVEGNVMKGIGTAGKAIGGLIGSIPLVKEGPVDEWLIDGGNAVKENAKEKGDSLVHALSEVSNPGTGVFIDNIDKLSVICNSTTKICIDKENIYLVA